MCCLAVAQCAGASPWRLPPKLSASTPTAPRTRADKLSTRTSASDGASNPGWLRCKCALAVQAVRRVYRRCATCDGGQSTDHTIGALPLVAHHRRARPHPLPSTVRASTEREPSAFRLPLSLFHALMSHCALTDVCLCAWQEQLSLRARPAQQHGLHVGLGT